MACDGQQCCHSNPYQCVFMCELTAGTLITVLYSAYDYCDSGTTELLLIIQLST